MVLSSSFAPTAAPTSSSSAIEVVAVAYPVLNYSTTIVTCFFDLAKQGQITKHPPSFYLKKGHVGTLSLAQPMVIFTDSPVEVAQARQPYMNLTRIVNVSLTEFEAYQRFYERIAEVFPRDREGAARKFSPLLFTVYFTKSECVKRAIQLDYFHTDKYIYIDVGGIRGWSGIRTQDYAHKPFPAPDREWLLGRGDRVQMQSVGGAKNPCESNIRWVEGEHPLDVKHVPEERKVPDAILVEPRPVRWWIAGSMFSGNKKSLLQYHDLYMYELDRYLQANFTQYSLDDQFMMGALACRYDLIEVVRPPKACCSKRLNRAWLFMLMFYSTDTYPQTDYTAEELVERQRKAEFLRLAEERREARKLEKLKMIIAKP